jgi:hypothetical protein
MKTRVEVNEAGDFFIIIPEDVVAEAGLDEGDLMEWDANDPELIILSIA